MSRNHLELGLSNEQLVSMYSKMILIRLFEDKVFELFTKKLVPGTTHLCQGQEAVSVGAMENISKEDWMTCTYRGHGHSLAKGIGPNALMAEILGKSAGCCQGKGGSMHIADKKVGALGSFAIVGAGLPVAVGAALSSWYRGTNQVAITFFGDGAANIGAFHESLNMASVMKLPVIFVCENNLYGEYTPISKSTSVPNIADRASSYGMPGVIVDGNQVLEVYHVVKDAVNSARSGLGPTLIECKTYRQKGHSRTDPGKYRPDSEVAHWLARDPIKLFGKYLVSKGIASGSKLVEIDSSEKQVVEAAHQFALDSSYPDEKEVVTNVYV